MVKYTLLAAFCLCINLNLSMCFDEVGPTTLGLILYVVAHVAFLAFLIIAQVKEDELKNRIATLEKKLNDKEEVNNETHSNL